MRKLLILCLLAGCTDANPADLKLACDTIEQRGLEQDFKRYKPMRECEASYEHHVAPGTFDIFGNYYPPDVHNDNYRGNGPTHGPFRGFQ